MCLHDDTAAGCRIVVSVDLILVAVDVVDVGVAFPLIVHLRDGDQLDRLPLLQDPGGLSELALVLSDKSLGGFSHGRIWKPEKRVEQVHVVLEQLLPGH